MKNKEKKRDSRLKRFSAISESLWLKNGAEVEVNNQRNSK